MSIGLISAILSGSRRELKELDGFRFPDEARSCEYELSYNGGFAPIASVKRRRAGRTCFKWFCSVDVSRCRTPRDAMERIRGAILRKKTEKAGMGTACERSRSWRTR